jgi:hypothetical protein
MVIEYIRYQVPAECHAEFIAAYRSAGHENGFRKSAEFGPFFPSIREMKHYQLT